MAQSRRGALILSAVVLLGVDPLTAVAAQVRTNIYRYVLDVDVPESPGLVALGMAPTNVYRGSAPKPFAVSLIHRTQGSDWATGAAVDVVPYYLAGGGVRTLASYRKNTVAGRLLRVLTKTALSIAAISDPDQPGTLRAAFALRATFHDPHDPVLNSRLPEQVDSALAAADGPAISPDDEDTSQRGADLARLFAEARRAMRARGDVQVSGGWGVGAVLEDAALESDRISQAQHTLWLTAQHALGGRLDILATAQLRDAFDSGRKMRFGLGFQRKAHSADFRVEAYYDGVTRRLYPGLSAELHALPGLGAVASLSSDTPIGALSRDTRVRINLLIRWYAASGR